MEQLKLEQVDIGYGGQPLLFPFRLSDRTRGCAVVVRK